MMAELIIMCWVISFSKTRWGELDLARQQVTKQSFTYICHPSYLHILALNNNVLWGCGEPTLHWDMSVRPCPPPWRTLEDSFSECHPYWRWHACHFPVSPPPHHRLVLPSGRLPRICTLERYPDKFFGRPSRLGSRVIDDTTVHNQVFQLGPTDSTVILRHFEYRPGIYTGYFGPETLFEASYSQHAATICDLWYNMSLMHPELRKVIP